mgnify:FL=1
MRVALEWVTRKRMLVVVVLYMHGSVALLLWCDGHVHVCGCFWVFVVVVGFCEVCICVGDVMCLM